MHKVCVCTIIASNYFSRAELLAKSYKKNHPDHDFFVLFIDDLPAESPYFKTVCLSDIKTVKNVKSLLFKYNITEFSTAIKPFFLEFLIEREDSDTVLYVDPDIYVFKPLSLIFEKLENHDVVLTPHITAPLDEKVPSEWDISACGYYNLGFVGFRVNEETKKFIKWWRSKTYNFCFADRKNYMFTDQKWMDFAPCYLDSYIVREKGYNVAYWNLHQYIKKIPISEVVFFHFSGFDPMVKSISKFQNRYEPRDLKGYNWFFDFYREELFGYFIKDNGYKYDKFEDGEKITPEMRRSYANGIANNIIDAGENPFCSRKIRNWIVSVHFRNVFAILYAAMSQTDDEFVDNLYYTFFLRLPDNDGRKYWVYELENGRSSRLWAIYFVINSDEFKLKNTNTFSLSFLKTLLLSLMIFTHPMQFIKKILLGKKHKQLKPSSKTGFNVSGYIDSDKGLGDSARGMIKALKEGGIGFAVNNIIVDNNRGNNEYTNIFSNQNPYGINLICVNADQAPVTVNFFLPWGKGYLKNRYNIGYWYWETPELPEEYAVSFKFFNEIWAATDFVCNAISIKSPLPVIKIPPAFLKPEIKESNRIFEGLKPSISNDDFVFLSIFDANSFWQRKNPEAVLEAFSKAFGKEKRAKLIIKIVNQNEESGFYQEFENGICGNDNVILINQNFSPELMDKLYSRANAYISLHRCEGLGIPLLKSMMLSKPVIATAYGGNTDFMNASNSYMVEFDKYIVKEDIGPYKKGTVWADADVEQAAFYMRNIFYNYNGALRIAKKGERDVIDYFDPGRIAVLIHKRLKVIKSSV